MKLYHNVIQNRNVPISDDVADRIVTDGFAEPETWLCDRPVGDGRGGFCGVVVAVPDDAVLSEYEVPDDSIGDFGETARVYCVPSYVINHYPRERFYPREDELLQD